MTDAALFQHSNAPCPPPTADAPRLNDDFDSSFAEELWNCDRNAGRMVSLFGLVHLGTIALKSTSPDLEVQVKIAWLHPIVFWWWLGSRADQA